MNCETDLAGEVCFAGTTATTAAGLDVEGALRRTIGLALTGEGGDGGGMVLSTTGSALMLDTDCDLARRERAILKGCA